MAQKQVAHSINRTSISAEGTSLTPWTTLTSGRIHAYSPNFFPRNSLCLPLPVHAIVRVGGGASDDGVTRQGVGETLSSTATLSYRKHISYGQVRHETLL